MRLVRLIVGLGLILASGPRASAQLGLLNLNPLDKLEPLLRQRLSLTGRSRVIIHLANGGTMGVARSVMTLLGGTTGRSLPLINGIVVDLPNVALRAFAGNGLVGHISIDRRVGGSMERTGATVGATGVHQDLGYDGAGVGVAIIDSGSSLSPDDLTDATSGASRVDRFVDFVNGRGAAYDDYGHGTHVAGIVAGNGFDSDGARTGIAPAAHVIALKTLDQSGSGRISDVIAALDYAISHKNDLNIRVVNLSIATPVYESYDVDPLAQATKAAVAAGLVVVTAAGNDGRSPEGRTQYGGVTAPGNAPWVLTVGASSHMGTADRADDTIAGFSSRGPSAIDYAAKPDLVAPGVGIESLSDPDSAFYISMAPYLLSGTAPTSYLPYLSLSGTSMAAPVVSGTVALMLQANPDLTPNEVKAILQYTAQRYSGYDRLTQGAGFLNARGAVELARFLAAPDDTPYPPTDGWSEQLIWGRRLIEGGQLAADANAWRTDVVWGANVAPNGAHVTWGTGLVKTGNVVWGSQCGGGDCDASWSVSDSGGSTVGASDGDTVVWGTSDGDTVVWGTSDGDTVVWGTSCVFPSCEPVVWNRP